MLADDLHEVDDGQRSPLLFKTFKHPQVTIGSGFAAFSEDFPTVYPYC
jgi:hypothetical protein